MNKLRNRNHIKKSKQIAICSIIILFIAIAFAALSATLGITSNARIAKVNWGVYFENLEEVDGSVEARRAATINESDKTKIDFGVDLNIPGDYYEFEVDVVNSGTIDAKISDIRLDGLSLEQLKYLKYSYWYADETEVKIDDILKAGERDRIIVRVEFSYDVTEEELPTVETTINLDFKITYVQDRSKADSRKKYIYNFTSEYATLDNMASRYVLDESGIDFSRYIYSSSEEKVIGDLDTTEENIPFSSRKSTGKLDSVFKIDTFEIEDLDIGNGTGLYVRAGTENDENPIFYYRGNVSNNNVIFAGFCWKIVRTTETGGTKLVYSGIPKDGVCNNVGEDATIGSINYNEYGNSLADVGYMYGDRYEVAERRMNNTYEVGLKFANDVNWNGTNYELIGTFDSTGNWSNDYKSVLNKHRYTCLSTSDTCDSVFYITYAIGDSTQINKSGMVYITLSNGKTFEIAKEDMMKNTNDSVMKGFIEDWYENNLLDYTSYLETDAVWCNNRNIISGAYLSRDSADTSGISSFETSSPYSMVIKDEEVCPNINDRFTVSSSTVGNKKLKYPIGLLTRNELVMSGSASLPSISRMTVTNVTAMDNVSGASYLNDNTPLWYMSPREVNSLYIYGVASCHFSSNWEGLFSRNNCSNINFYRYVKPSVSLNKGIKPVSGDGTANHPYIVE